MRTIEYDITDRIFFSKLFFCGDDIDKIIQYCINELDGILECNLNFDDFRFILNSKYCRVKRLRKEHPNMINYSNNISKIYFRRIRFILKNKILIVVNMTTEIDDKQIISLKTILKFIETNKKSKRKNNDKTYYI